MHTAQKRTQASHKHCTMPRRFQGHKCGCAISLCTISNTNFLSERTGFIFYPASFSITEDQKKKRVHPQLITNQFNYRSSKKRNFTNELCSLRSILCEATRRFIKVSVNLSFYCLASTLSAISTRLISGTILPRPWQKRWPDFDALLLLLICGHCRCSPAPLSRCSPAPLPFWQTDSGTAPNSAPFRARFA